jgi:thymidine kinase
MKNPEIHPIIKSAVLFKMNEIKEVGGSCLICGKEATMVGVFIPPKNSLHNADNIISGGSKSRHFVYVLCDEHGQQNVKSAENVEKHLYNIFFG